MRYTRAVKRPELWRKNFLLMLRRAPRDRRTWRPLLAAVGAVAYIGYDIWAFFYLGLAGTIVWVIILTLAIILALVLARSYRRTDESMLLLSARPSVPDEDFAGHRPRLLQTLFTTAALVDRAGIELMHRQNRMNPAFAGKSRRRTLDLVQSCGMDQLTPREQDLLRSQEGAWPEADIWATIFQIESVRVLRWVLGFDPILVPLEFAELDLRPALEITTRPVHASTSACLGPADLRAAKLLASQLLDRLVAEGTHRGFYQVPEGDTRTRLSDMAARMRESAARDQLVGVHTVAEASEQRIRFVAQTALRRVLALTDVIAYLTGPPEADFRMRAATEDPAPDQPMSGALAG